MTTVKAISPMDMVYSPVRVKVYRQLTEPDMIALIVGVPGERSLITGVSQRRSGIAQVAQSAVQEYPVLCCCFEPQQTL